MNSFLTSMLSFGLDSAEFMNCGKLKFELNERVVYLGILPIASSARHTLNFGYRLLGVPKDLTASTASSNLDLVRSFLHNRCSL